MLGKLIKYEFKHTSKTMLTTYAALALATLMGSLALFQMESGSADDGTFFSIISVVMFVIYIIAIIGVYCVDFIYLSWQYHKTMYSSQGYLTHTLPVSPAAALGSKILVFFVWMLLSSLLSVLSVMILLQVGTGGEFLRELNSITWSDFSREVYELFGMSGGLLIFLFTVTSLLGILLYILWITASMAIGQLSQKNRTVCSILAAFCFYVISQIVSTLLLFASGYSTHAFLDGDLQAFIHTIIIRSIALTAVFLIVLYGICLYINKRKLNLD